MSRSCVTSTIALRITRTKDENSLNNFLHFSKLFFSNDFCLLFLCICGSQLFNTRLLIKCYHFSFRLIVEPDESMHFPMCIFDFISDTYFVHRFTFISLSCPSIYTLLLHGLFIRLRILTWYSHNRNTKCRSV